MGTQITLTELLRMKGKGEKIVALTAYDFPFAEIVDKAGVDMVLIGDSLGMVVQGKTTTIPVTMEEMLYHTDMVSRAARRAMVIGDMPFMSYQASLEDAVFNAGRFLKEAGAQAVKLEGGASVYEIIKAISKAGIPVQGHIGLTPQSVHQMGGYKVQRDEKRLVEDAIKVEAAGAFSVVLEGIPPEISKKITNALKIPTIGIGAGPDCDGQILVLHDLLGLNERYLPKFAKKYADLREAADDGIKKYAQDVRTKEFPGREHCY